MQPCIHPRPSDTRVKTTKSIVYEILSEEIQRADGAALGYLEDAMLQGLDGEEVKKKFLEGLPFVGGVLGVEGVGRILTIILPRFQGEVLGADEETLIAEIRDAGVIAARLGVKAVSLTGLIPSATQHGIALRRLCTSDKVQHPLYTTGHATTTACIVMNVAKILELVGGKMSASIFVVIGLGSIGTAAVKLAMSVLEHPKELWLVDVKGKKSDMEKLAATSPIKTKILISSGGSVPDEIYTTTQNPLVILGATNVGGVLDPVRVPPGTVIIDDSAPHIFDPEKLWQRMTTSRDVLATEGGPLTLPTPRTERVYTPTRWVTDTSLLPPPPDPKILMGCTLSSLFTASDPVRYPPQIGGVGIAESVAHYEKLKEMGCEGCLPNIDDVMVPGECYTGGVWGA